MVSLRPENEPEEGMFNLNTSSVAKTNSKNLNESRKVNMKIINLPEKTKHVAKTRSEYPIKSFQSAELKKVSPVNAKVSEVQHYKQEILEDLQSIPKFKSINTKPEKMIKTFNIKEPNTYRQLLSLVCFYLLLLPVHLSFICSNFLRSMLYCIFVWLFG